MSDYTYNTSPTLSARDSLPDTDANKVVKGADVEAQFLLIETAVATKYDSTDIASTGQAQSETLDTKLMTPLKTGNWADANAGMVGDIHALADPNDDRILGWDDSAGAAIGFDLGRGLETSTTNLQTTCYLPDIKVKTNTEPLTSPDTSLNNDADLAGWSLTTNKQYAFKFVLYVQSPAAADLKYLLNFSQTPQFARAGVLAMPVLAAAATTSVAGSSSNDIDTTSVAITNAGDDLDSMVVIEGFFKANAATGGNMALQWAQQTGDAGTTQILRGSYGYIWQLD